MSTVRAMVSTEQWGDVDPRPAIMLREAGIEIVRNKTGGLLVEDQMRELIRGCEVAISGAEPMSAAVMDNAPNLRFISRCSVGLDSIDLLAARERGIPVAYVPGANSEAVAELTLSHMLTLLRGVQKGDATLRSGSWSRVMGRCLSEMTVGVIGVGRIGKRVVRHVRHFGAMVIANDLAPDDDFGVEFGIEWVTKDRLLREADIVCLHVPRTPHTYGMIGNAELAVMKDGALLINTARGGLIDEPALVEALRSGKLAGAGLDVFEQEPYQGELTTLENVILTCHMAANTRSSRLRMEIQAAENLICFLKGEPIPRMVPEIEYEYQALAKARRMDQ